MAIQLAKLVPNLNVIATASRKETTEWCLELGADFVIDHSKYLVQQLKGIGIAEVDNILICNSPDKYLLSSQFTNDIFPSLSLTTAFPAVLKPFGV